jgi:hypothetical protein
MKMMVKRVSAIAVAIASVTITAQAFSRTGQQPPTATLLLSGLEGAFGSTVGPGGALYVTESAAGIISRVDPVTGATTTFATGLPRTIPAVGIGGAVDIAFIGSRAYVLVTLVGPDVGGQDVVGIYRVDRTGHATPIADIGEFSIANPPAADFFIPSGVQYALEAYGDGLLVTDGHHNRVLKISLERHHGTERGRVSELIAFDNIVPTGLALSGHRVYMAEAGPVPHMPQDGKVVTFGSHARDVKAIASGARLLVDVEFGRGRTLFGLSQGEFLVGSPEGSPALPNTGALMREHKGTFIPIVTGLNLPTSFEIIGTTAYVVSLAGEIWKIEGVACPPYGNSR